MTKRLTAGGDVRISGLGSTTNTGVVAYFKREQASPRLLSYKIVEGTRTTHRKSNRAIIEPVVNKQVAFRFRLASAGTKAPIILGTVRKEDHRDVSKRVRSGRAIAIRQGSLMFGS